MQIIEAVAPQIAPERATFYIYGESGRLARPVLFAALSGLITAEQWQDWFASLASPQPFADWPSAYASQEGLAKIHNTRAFALVLYANSHASENANLAPIREGATQLLRAIP